ncbi:MAG: hypothetical protein R2706_04505 [Acidimicrobiales bacterium]
MAKTDRTRISISGRVAVVVALLAGMLAGTGSPASAREGGITVANDTVYEVDPDTGKIRVVATITVTNVKANTTSGNYIRRYYWSGMTTPIPADAEDLSITNGNGAALSWEPMEDDEIDSDEVLLPRSRLRSKPLLSADGNGDRVVQPDRCRAPVR